MAGFLKLMIFIETIGICFLALPTEAQVNPKVILEKADEARGNLEGIEWEIDIDSVERGRNQNRNLIVKARDFNSLAEFTAPAKVKGQKVLMIDRNMWFIKPGLRKPVPISPRQKLMGQASNGDIASTNYAGDYRVESMSEETVGGEPCYLFDLIAANKNVTYDRIRYWVSKDRMVGVRAEFFTVSGKMFKSATFEYDNTVTVEGEKKPFISKMVITNAVLKADVTTMTYSKAKVNKIPDSTFNLNLLMR
jgi:hypothetical protein